MGYGNSIAEAIARMGQARSDAALRRGQIYGNLAQNIGNIPGQVIQGVQDYKQNQIRTQAMQLQLEQQKRDAEFQKQYQVIASDPSIPEQMKEQQLDNLIRQYHPEKWLDWQRLKQTQLYAQQRELNTVNENRQGTPGTMNPLQATEVANKIGVRGVEAQLPMPRTGQNAFSPIGQAFEPVVPLEAQRVHPPIMSPEGPLYAETDTQRRQKKLEDVYNIAKETARGKAAGSLPKGLTPTQDSRWRTKNIGGRVMQYNPETGQYDIDAGPVEDPNASREPKKYGSMQFVQIFDPKSGLPQNYWVDTVKQTITPAIPGGRTEPREIAGQSQTVIQGADTSLPVLKELENDLKTLDTGPLRGRAAAISLSALGGAGLSKEEVAIRSKLGRLTADQIFGEGGKQLTETEKAMIQPYVVNQTDTVQTALAKIPELRKRIERIRNTRFNMMNPRTRAVHSNIARPGSAAEPPIEQPEADPLGLFK